MTKEERDKKISETISNLAQTLLTISEAEACIEEISEEYAKQKCNEQKEIDLHEIISPTTFPRGTQSVGRPYYLGATQMGLAEVIKKAPLATDK